MGRWWQLFGLLFMLLFNGMAIALPLNGRTTAELSAVYPNLFVPAGITFSVWGLIYLLLILFVLAPWTARTDPGIEQRTTAPFVVSCFANGSWIVAWHYELVLLSVLIMGVLLTSLALLYAHTRDARAWMVRIPVSVYLGWICVATVANITALLVRMGSDPPIPVQVTLTLVMIGVALGLGLWFLRSFRDRSFGLVVAWALAGIALRHVGQGAGASPPVLFAAIGGAALILSLVVLSSLRPQPR